MEEDDDASKTVPQWVFLEYSVRIHISSRIASLNLEIAHAYISRSGFPRPLYAFVAQFMRMA